MVLEPLPWDPAELAALLFHEAWHRHQKELGYPANMAVARHLDDPVSRYLARLEWAALEKALLMRGEAQRRHVAQALAFRARRLGGNPEAAAAERDQMRHEGIASYTGAALSGDPLRIALQDLREGPSKPALGRSFAYVGGAAWGLLLDRLRPGWRASRDPLDLADMMPFGAAATARADDYGGTAILLEETLASVERQRRIAAAVAATAEGRALRLPLARMSMDFDPNRVLGAPDGSSIYEKMILSDRWGRVAVDGVPLRISADFTAAYLPWPLASGALELKPGWRVEGRPDGTRTLVGPNP